MPDDDDNDLSAKKKKDNGNKKKFNIASRLFKNKTTRKFWLRFLPLIFLIMFLVGIALFIINGAGLIIGEIEEWARGIMGNIQQMLVGDDSAKITNEEIVKLAQYLENMGYDTQAYGLGNPIYEKDSDGNTKNKGSGNVKTVVGVDKSVDGKEYLRSYISASEHTYCLAENSFLGFFTSLWDNVVALIKGDPFTSNEAKSTGLIQIVGPNADEYKKRVSIDRDRKQFRVYANAFALDSAVVKMFTGDDKIRWGEVYSYDIENWIGRYGRPKELFLALHLSTLMPDLTYEIATGDDFNTKVEMSMIPINTVFDVSATKDGETIDGNKVKELYEAYCKTNIQDKTNKKIPNSKWTYGEIDELHKLLDAQATAQKNSGEATMDFDSVSEDNGHFTKYNLTDEQARNIAKVCCREQGTGDKAGIAAEASLMANLFERKRGSNSYIKKGAQYSTDTIYDFVRHDDWFGGRTDKSEKTMDSPNGDSQNPVNDEAVDIVKQVLVKGKRTLPTYVLEHDSPGDLAYVITNGQQLNPHDHKNYVKNQTTVVQSTAAFGSDAGQWTFFCFPSEDSDPFGYFEADGSSFYYQIGLGTTSSTNSTPSISSDGTPNVPFVTGVNISREEFINKCKQARPNTEFVQYAGEVYDVCVKNNINPIFCATQGIVEQGWNSPDTAKGNFWGLGIFNGQSTSSYGSMDVASYTQAWCDNIKDRLKGGWGTLEESKRLHPYNSKFTGEIKTIYDVLANYAAPYNGYVPPQEQADCMIEYIDKPIEGLLDIARNTFGDEYVDLENSYGSIDMLWPFVTGVKKHWFYNDIDFTKNTYRFAKDAKKVMEYKPEDDDNILNKNNVDVKLNATLTSNMGMIYQVAEPEASGPNDAIMELFDGDYYKYDGTTDRAQYIAAAKAQDIGKTSYNFNGEDGYPVLKNLAKKVKKEKVSFDNSRIDDSLTAFGLLENMHTESSEYIYRNLKELMIARKYFSESDLTTDVKKIMLWPIQTNNQFTKWETETSDNDFGKIIYCDEKEKTVLAPFDGKITKIGNNEITIKLGKLNKESAKLLEEIHKQKDPYVKIDRELLTGMKLTIKGIKLKTELKKGDKIKRGDRIGEVYGTVNGKTAIKVTMQNTADESISEDIFEYMAQEENSKYEEIFEKKQKATEELAKKKGIDISPLAYIQGAGSTSAIPGIPGQLDTTQAGNGSEGTFTSSKGIAYKCFKQGQGYGATGDGGWGDDKYGNGRIWSWGCGATSVAIIASGLKPSLNYTPRETAAIIQQKYSGSDVLSFEAVKYGMDRIGMNAEIISSPSAQQIQDLLRAGKVMILSVNKPPSIFPSTAGHYIAALDINLNGEIFIANCNANLAAPSGWYTPDQVAAGCNGIIVTDSR